MKVILTTEELSNILNSIHIIEIVESIKTLINNGCIVSIQDYNGHIMKTISTENEFEEYLKLL